MLCVKLKADLHSTNVSRATVRQDPWAWAVSVAAQDHIFYFIRVTEKTLN